MAKDVEKQATCPICGYTDTAMDAEALEEAMAEHMQQAHNMSAPVNPDNTDLKRTGDRDDIMHPAISNPTTGTPPTVPPGSIVAPGNNVGPNEIP